MFINFWYPIGLSSEINGEKPFRAQVFGLPFVAFRDEAGAARVVSDTCVHRGGALNKGWIRGGNVVCPYHGWAYGGDGKCTKVPSLGDDGKIPARAKVDAYPVQERYGLIFAYLGPPARRPVLPRYDVLETLDPGEMLEADDSSVGGGGPAVIPCNWLQHYENLMDTLHVPILHGSFSGPQFTAPMGLMPEVTWELSDRGVKAISDRRLLTYGFNPQAEFRGVNLKSGPGGISFDVVIDGRPRKIVAQPTKQAFLYVFDRITGEPIWPIVEQPVPQGDVPGEHYSRTQPIPSKPPAYDRQGTSTDDLIDISNRGFEIGAHTLEHPILGLCDIDRAREEIGQTREVLEGIIKRPVTSFAYPNGHPAVDFSAQHIQMVKQAGYRYAVTTQWGVANANTSPYQIPRFTPWGPSRTKMTLQLIRNFYSRFEQLKEPA